MNHSGPSGGGQDFKDLLGKCLRQAGLSPRALHLELRRQRAPELQLPETTIDSWLRPHSMTGQPSLPRGERLVSLLAQWLCAREGVSATTEQLVAAWRADMAHRAGRRAKPTPAPLVAPEATSPAPLPEARASSGVVTFLSARLAGARPVRSAGAHLLLRVVTQHGGSPIPGERSETLAVFAQPEDALAAAVDAQRGWADQDGIDDAVVRPRMAIHSGRAPHSSSGYAGAALHHVRRLAAVAHPGQVLVSEAVQVAVGSRLPEGGRLEDLGRPRPLGLSTHVHLFSLSHPSFPSEFPPLRSLDAYPNNLPLQLTTFIGRDEQLEELRRAFVTNRLCTLTGSGGVGKTRLALHLAAELIEDFADGTWVVDLASAPEPGVVAPMVAGVLGLQEAGTGTFATKAQRSPRPLARRLAQHLSARQLLLLLDNCEHVVESCASLVDELLQACPGLAVLCTSREPLGVSGECVYRVPTLAVPPPDPTLSLQALAAYESVQLFLDRAAQRRPDIQLAEPDIRAVAGICQQVEGSALAIELAAARVKMLSPRQILELLGDRFALLTSGSRTALARHQTLRGTIDWSYDQLPEGQKTLLQRLSVFAGGFDLLAAQAVCAGEGLERFEVLDLLGMLVDKSLVETDQHEGAIRYRLLETIRAYAGEKLATAGESDVLRQRHREWYLALAERAERGLKGADQIQWLDALELDDDNLRAALESGSDPEDAQQSLRLAAALGHFWLVRGIISEGRRHLERALVKGGDAPAVLRAKALAVAGHLAMFDADVEGAAEHAEGALALSGQLGYRRGEAWALRTLWWVASSREQFSEALSRQHDGLAAARELADPWETAFSLTNIGNVEARWGRFEEASAHYEEGLALRRELHDFWGLTWSLFRLGSLRTWQGRFGEAEQLLSESLAHAGRLRYGAGTVITLLGLGQAAHVQGDQTTAKRRYAEACAKARDLEDRSSIILSLIGLAAVATACGNCRDARQYLDSDEVVSATTTPSTEVEHLRASAKLAQAGGQRGRAADLHARALVLRHRGQDARGVIEQLEELAVLGLEAEHREAAATLLGLTSSRRRAMGAPVPPLYRPAVQRATAQVRSTSPARLSAAWTRGSELTLEAAIDVARNVAQALE